MRYGKANYCILKTRLGEILQNEWMTHSEILTPFLSEDDIYGDGPHNIGMNFDLDSVKISEVLATKTELLKCTQESLIFRGLGDQFIVYRYGPIRSFVPDITAVTLNISVALDGARRATRILDAPLIANKYLCNRSDVFVDIEAFWPQKSLAEEELLVNPNGLKLLAPIL